MSVGDVGPSNGHLRSSLAEAVEKNLPIESIKNLWVKKNNKITKNPVRNLIDEIDSLPFPDFDINTHYLLEKGKIRKFKEKDLAGQIFFLTGRGCPYGCDYCSNRFFNDLYQGKRKKILRHLIYFFKLPTGRLFLCKKINETN